MDRNEKGTRPYLQVIQPFLLVLVLLTYFIGPGLIHYQGGTVNWPNIFLGSLLGLLLLLVKEYLSAYFDHPDSLVSTLHREDPLFFLYQKLDRRTLLAFSLTFLTAGALTTVLIITRNNLSLPSFLLLCIAFLGTFFSGMPSYKLGKNGYGDIFEAVLICNLVPALGYLMNDNSLHILLVMLTIPMTLVYLAYKIVHSLESYSFDSTHGYRSLAVRLDWKRAMVVHNYLILIAFLFLGIFPLLGQPWSITWPVLLTIPVGVFQVVQMLELLSGGPTRWKLLKLTASGMIVVMAYLIALTLWIR